VYMDNTMIIISIGVVILMGIVGFSVGYALAKKSIITKLKEAEQKAGKMIEDSKRETETLKRVSLLEAKEEIAKQKEQVDRDLRQKRNELRDKEGNVEEREKNIDKKNEMLRKKETGLLQI